MHILSSTQAAVIDAPLPSGPATVLVDLTLTAPCGCQAQFGHRADDGDVALLLGVCPPHRPRGPLIAAAFSDPANRDIPSADVFAEALS